MSRIPYKIFWQLGLTVTVSLLLIEGVALWGSSISRENEYLELRREIKAAVADRFQLHVDSLDLDFLSDEDIARRMAGFQRNVYAITAAIIILLIVATLMCFHLIAGRYILELTRLNIAKDSNLYSLKKIPNNELGALIRTREDMLKKLKSHQDNLQQNLDEAKEQLLHSAKLSAMGEFTSTIIHDIKNPLSVIRMHLSLLSNPNNNMTEEARLKFLDNAQLASDRISDLVDRMGQFSRVKAEFSEECDVDQAIQNAILFVANKASVCQVEVNYNEPSEPVHCWGDPTSLEQAFMNLISNACDAMKDQDKRELNITIDSAENDIVVSFQDSGCGIDADTLPRVFQSFFTTKPKGEGTGLGLSSLKKVMDTHCGHIDLDSEVGVGTTFYLRFCRHKPSQPNSTIAA